MPTEKTQMDMFQEDILNSILGQTLQVGEPSKDAEDAEDTVEETEIGE